VGKQLNLALSGRTDSALPLNWRRLDRRARRLAASIAQQTEGLRDGLVIRQYADEAARLEALRAQLAGKHLKRDAKRKGCKLAGKAAALMAATPEGRRLHRVVDQLEARLAVMEAVALCG
jgi:hypothetical protein